jgi:hypothetical protein
VEVLPVTAVVSQGDLGRLRRLAGAWYRANAWQRLSLGWSAWRDLTALLDEIEARRAKGGDELCAHVRGDSIPEMEAAALLKAAELWGPDAELAIEETGTVSAHSPAGWRCRIQWPRLCPLPQLRGSLKVTRARRLTVILALAAFTAATAAACGPSGSPGCPPGQWQVYQPGAGPTCAPGSATVYTPPGGAR